MKIKNVSKRKYMHAVFDENNEQIIISINPDETKEIDDKIANLWLKTGEVVKVDDGSKDKEIERLKAENEKLKAQAENDQSEKTGNDSLKEELLAKCKEYGLKIGNPKTAKIETLQKKIADYEALQSAE